MIETEIDVHALDDDRYRLFVDGLGDPLVVNSTRLRHALDLTYGDNVAAPLETIETVGRLHERPSLDFDQIIALEVFLERSRRGVP